MTRRLLALGLVTTVLALGGINARAGTLIPLPTTFDSFVEPSGGTFVSNGNFTTTTNGLTFGGFTYFTDPVGSPPAPANIGVFEFAPGGGENGLQFRGGFFAAANQTVDYSITYTVSAPSGALINDALLGINAGNGGGTGTVEVVEKFRDSITGQPLGTLDATLGNPDPAPLTITGTHSSISVEKDIFLFGGSLGASTSVINQGFSVVPEPTSMALLGIGLTGLFTFRRFFKRAFVA